MKRTGHFAGKVGVVLCSTLLGCAAYGQPSVGVSVDMPGVEIRAESDFYEPLTQEGDWVAIGSYGRCWRPSHVERDWRPYSNGSWERTDAGWYWVSDEPWAWATYHYGRWDYTDQYGWYWVPQIQWAPAWVSWHEGGGYIGWAPLQPSVGISVNGFVGFNESRISPRAFVFVKEDQFLSPIRPSIVAANNTTIINRTRTVTNTRIVNQTVINEGPAPAVIEKASGRKVQAVPVQQLRRQAEAPVAAKQPATKATSEKIQTPAAPVSKEAAQPGEKKAGAPTAPAQIQKPEMTPRAPTPLAPTGRVNENQNPKPTSPPQAVPTPEKQQPAAPQPKPEPRPQVKPEVSHPAAAVNPPTEPNAIRPPVSQEKPVQPDDKKAPQPAREKPAAGQTPTGTQPDKEHGNKP